MSEFLLEILSEEIPARMQQRAKQDIIDFFKVHLNEHKIDFSCVSGFVSPRRLGLSINGLSVSSPDIAEERKGPKIDAPEKAIEGFLRSTGLSREQCEERETPKGTFLFAVIKKAGRPTEGILAETLEAFLKSYKWPKSMTWGNTKLSWVRPIRHILAALDGSPIPFKLYLGGGVDPSDLAAGSSTFGHRFLSPEKIQVSSFSDYKEQLKKSHVLVDDEQRKTSIWDAIEKTASAKGLIVRPHEKLLEEVCGLVEWPVIYIASILKDYMGLPEELLTTTMRVHQRYFPTHDKHGNMAPFFVVVANHAGSDQGSTIIDGNERVLQARLNDAAFFWDNDRKEKLDTFNEALKKQVFHGKLGTLHQKLGRIVNLVKSDALKSISADCRTDAIRAAELCKADLNTGMVFEFPELQGIMGKYYARNMGENDVVAQAIEDHYAPQGPGDDCPNHPASIVVSLADKIDTLVGFFAVDLKPTGSKDPYALRRAALGVIRLLRENDISMSLHDLLEASYELYKGQGVDGILSGEDMRTNLESFIVERLKVYLKAEGIRHDLINAALGDNWDGDVARLVSVVTVLKTFIETEDGENLVAAYKRAANIVRIEESKSDETFEGSVEPNLLEANEEKKLFESLVASNVQVQIYLDPDNNDFQSSVANIATLRPHVDRFFDQVTVNAEEPDVRKNRLNILAMMRTTMESIADFSKLEG